jgi:hypothetical protein
MDLTMMERVGDRLEKMEGSCSTGQSPQWAVVPMEEKEEEEEEEFHNFGNVVFIGRLESRAGFCCARNSRSEPGAGSF